MRVNTMIRAISSLAVHHSSFIIHRTSPVALVLLGLVVACGGRPLENEIERHPAQVLPQGASQVFYGRVDRLRGDPLLAWAMEQGENIRWGQSLRGISEMLRPAGEITRIALGTYGAADKEPSAAVVAIGQFDGEAFRQALESARTPFVESSYENHGLFTCGRGNARCYICFPSPRVIVAASQEDLLKRTVDLSKRSKKSLARDQGFAPLLESFSPEMDFWATGLFPNAVATLLSGQLQSPAIQLIQAFTIQLTGNESKRLELVLHCASPEAAQANARILQDLLGLLATQIYHAGYRIDELLEALNRSEIVVEATRATFQIEMSRAEIAATAEALRAGPAEQPMPEPLAPPVPLP